MEISTVAILSPGDMGHAVGQRLRENELEVVTCLAGRSERTRTLSEKAGIQDVATLEELVERSDLIMSMTVSAAVSTLCQQVADAIRTTGSDILFAECNAIAPQLTRELARSSPGLVAGLWTYPSSAGRPVRATAPISTPPAPRRLSSSS